MILYSFFGDFSVFGVFSVLGKLVDLPHGSLLKLLIFPESSKLSHGFRILLEEVLRELLAQLTSCADSLSCGVLINDCEQGLDLLINLLCVPFLLPDLLSHYL